MMLRLLLQKNVARYHAIIAASKTGAWEYHSDTQYQWCSPEYFEMLGYDKNFFSDGKKLNIQDIWMRLLHPDDRQRAIEAFANYIGRKSSDMYEATFRMKHMNGEYRWIWSRGRTLMKPDGTVSSITLGTHIDITDRKNMELDLVTYNEKLIKYAHMTAHEVRGPLARLLGLIQVSKMTNDADYPWFFDKLKGEAHDIDKVLKEISEELSEIDEHHSA
ncbi:MAG: PAS domain-containing protein [Chryseolinea sp.]